ncbi:protein FAM169B-like isoform X1 [Dunckerocampus dactyliophorus]|uniref:protein FAM169B-like isoform X1 n=1 Tax=Dunckerocampus dactyliophorus TaxID=161453 RepID=UPI002407737E|nr:protein FAM169B-like isoform X1 [Dunckerocampus dactyliophorus]
MFPADLPPVDETELRSASEGYFLSLESRSHEHECFQWSESTKVTISASNVTWLQLFEDNQAGCSLLALHPPDRPTQVVALYLHGRWWSVDDVTRTSCKSRAGLVPVITLEFFEGRGSHLNVLTVLNTRGKQRALLQYVHIQDCRLSFSSGAVEKVKSGRLKLRCFLQVRSFTERLILFLLSQVVDGPSRTEALFSPHPRTERAKLLWVDGRAVGFYTVKHKGSLCDGRSSRCYLLPVLDSVLVRKSWRRRGLGLKMLADFCSSFPGEEELGVSVPLSSSMVAVCRRFLQLHEDHRERLYEVEAPGGWTQRRNIWLNIQLRRYPLSRDDAGDEGQKDSSRSPD